MLKGYDIGMDYVTPDTGCAISPTCLRCPLERCALEEEPATEQRYAAIYQARLRGATSAELMERFGVSERTVNRAVQRMRSAGAAGAR